MDAFLSMVVLRRLLWPDNKAALKARGRFSEYLLKKRLLKERAEVPGGREHGAEIYWKESRTSLKSLNIWHYGGSH